MKYEILRIIKKRMPEFISGEEISNTLQVSRTAIWKHIRSLREDGYVIESHPRIGYRLTSIPDRLYPEEISAVLKTKVIGSSIMHFQSVGSTNDVAKELASNGAPEGLIVVAEEQTLGRGRFGRAWSAPAGKGIWLSVIMRPHINPLDAPKLTLLSAVALARTFQSYPGVKPGIKWPNDLLMNGKKISGVLTEMSAEMERVNFVVLGIGININTEPAELPDEIRKIATSLYMETEQKWSRLEFVVKMLENLEELYLLFLAGKFLSIVEEWKLHSITLNEQIRVSFQGGYIEGTALDLDRDGALILKTKDGGSKKIVAGEVSFV